MLGVLFAQTEADDQTINCVNVLHSLFDGVMAGFQSVGTKRLNEYLTWFL